MTTKKEEKQTFEASMERLEEIVGDMEGGTLDLDKMIANFEEGQKLIQFCARKLDEVERKVEKLVHKDGDLTVEPFDPPQMQGS